MGSEFHRLVMVALAAGLLVIPGCGAGDGSKTGSGTNPSPPAVTQSVQPKIVSASIGTDSALHVTFSEAVQVPTGVDPAKFRLTMAYYTQVANAAGKNNKYSGYAYYSQYGYSGPNHTIYSDTGEITSIIAETSAAGEANLQLSSSFKVADACQEIATRNAATPGSHAGLYLHYSEAGSPTLEDLQGNKVASLAAYWSADPTIEQISGKFTGSPIPVAITCP